MGGLESISDRSSVRSISSVSAVFIMDELAIQKGHRCATTNVDPYPKRVLWVDRGHARESVSPFFELLGKKDCRAVRAGVLDASAAYENGVCLHWPQAEIVFDSIYIVAEYGGEVIDRARGAMRPTGSARTSSPVMPSSPPYPLPQDKENVTRSSIKSIPHSPDSGEERKKNTKGLAYHLGLCFNMLW